MTRCRTASTCNYPEGECVGLCLHRAQINTETMTKRCAAIKGNVEQRMPIEYADEPSALVAAWDAYKAHRAHGRIDGIRHAWRAFRSAR